MGHGQHGIPAVDPDWLADSLAATIQASQTCFH
jgi:hypothetical protein